MAGGTVGGNYWTFAELCSMVYTETNRPDLVAETQSAVLAATLALHTWEGSHFYKDIKTGLATFDSNGNNQSAYIQTLDTTVFPRYRSLSFIRKWDPTYNASELNPLLQTNLPSLVQGYPVNPQLSLGMLKILSPTDLMDEYNTEKVDVAYQAGNTIMIKSSTPISQAQIGFYAYPNTDVQNSYAGYDSWIAREYPFAVIYMAAGIVYAKIGNAESAGLYAARPDQNGNGGGLAWDHIHAMRNSNIVAEGW